VLLPEIAEPPPPPEMLGEHEISRMFEPEVSELRFVTNAVFIPQRVGAPNGTTEVHVVGKTSDRPQHPGEDYQTTQLYERMPLDRVRLGRYRWRFLAATVEPPFARVVVDRAAMPATLPVPGLADKEAVTFWLSTQGVAELELETRQPMVSKYSDYVEVRLDAHAGHDGSPWKVFLRARRCFTGCETVSVEQELVLGQHAGADVALGDHRLELLDVVWLGVSPAELHARARLTRGVTRQGLEPTKPQPPWRPLVR